MVREAMAPGIGRHVLVVDADDDDRRRLARALEFQGFALTAVSKPEFAREIVEMGLVDLVIVDPATVGEGFDAVALLGGDAGLPVIVVSGRADEGDRVVALRLGADDYVAKPFSAPELAARVLAVLRRYREREAAQDVLAYGDVEIDRMACQVRVRGLSVELTPREYELLLALATRPGRTCSRDELLAWVWDSSAEHQDPATVTEHVRRLRRKLKDEASAPRHLTTVRRYGYRWDP